MTHADNMIIRARAGDKQACDKLINLWYKRIYNYGYKYLGDHDRAMEVTQKTFISMCQKISVLEDASKFRPWLYRIACNYCHEEYRRNNRENMLFVNSDGRENEDRGEYNLGEAPSIERTLHQNDLNLLLEQAMQQLPPDQREVIIMKEYEGLKFREIAEALDVPENTVKSRLYYGLTHLKKMMEQKKLTKENLYYER